MAPQVVTIPRNAFGFCRWSLTALLWAALLLHHLAPLLAVIAILLVSALARVDRSPMVLLYRFSVARIWPPVTFEFLDVAAMRFAHGLGALLGAGVLATILRWPGPGRLALAGFCLLKTVSAFGFCPASKLFACLRKGGCCALTRGRC